MLTKIKTKNHSTKNQRLAVTFEATETRKHTRRDVIFKSFDCLAFKIFKKKIKHSRLFFVSYFFLHLNAHEQRIIEIEVSKPSELHFSCYSHRYDLDGCLSSNETLF